MIDLKYVKSPINECDKVVRLEDYQNDQYEVKELIDERLWVVKLQPESGHWLEFAFLEFSTRMDSGTLCDVVMHGGGPINGLNECRHTYWGEDGYIFYPNAAIIRAILDELELYYDMD